MRMLGETFQPCPRSRAASAPVPSVAMPPPPLAPSKFSGLIERVRAPEMRARLPSPIPRPLNAAKLLLLHRQIESSARPVKGERSTAGRAPSRTRFNFPSSRPINHPDLSNPDENGPDVPASPRTLRYARAAGARHRLRRRHAPARVRTLVLGGPIGGLVHDPQRPVLVRLDRLHGVGGAVTG